MIFYALHVVVLAQVGQRVRVGVERWLHPSGSRCTPCDVDVIPARRPFVRLLFHSVVYGMSLFRHSCQRLVMVLTSTGNGVNKH